MQAYSPTDSSIWRQNHFLYLPETFFRVASSGSEHMYDDGYDYYDYGVDDDNDNNIIKGRNCRLSDDTTCTPCMIQMG